MDSRIILLNSINLLNRLHWDPWIYLKFDGIHGFPHRFSGLVNFDYRIGSRNSSPENLRRDQVYYLRRVLGNALLPGYGCPPSRLEEEPSLPRTFRRDHGGAPMAYNSSIAISRKENVATKICFRINLQKIIDLQICVWFWYIPGAFWMRLGRRHT